MDVKNEVETRTNVIDHNENDQEIIQSARSACSKSSERGIFLTEDDCSEWLIVNYRERVDDCFREFEQILNSCYIEHSGPLLKMDRTSNDTSPRFVKLSRNILHAYSNSSELLQKEIIEITSVSSIQRLLPHKMPEDVLLYCFEIYVIPSMASQPTIIYGSTDLTVLLTWMRKLLRAMTSPFTFQHIDSCSRAGKCFVWVSANVDWQTSWIMLTRQRSLLISYDGGELETVDLRKVKSISMSEATKTGSLAIEAGNAISIETPDSTIHLIIVSVLETVKWKELLQRAALNNGDNLQDQQLTNDNVPVLVEKCVDFIFAHGLRAEGIYRKSGPTLKVQKLLELFKQDAMAVRLCPTDYNVHTIASCLKKFMQNLPRPLIGSLSMSFISVSRMEETCEKVSAYTELLQRLPQIKYQTLRKIVGHLNVIQSQAEYNLMDAQNLANVWGGNILTDPKVEDIEFSEEERNVVRDLIELFKDIFSPTAEELVKERKLLAMLPADIEDSIDKLKVWIKYVNHPNTDEEDKTLFQITLTPCKTAHDICKEIAATISVKPDQLTLSECILDGWLERPIHYAEIVLDTILRWSRWSDDDCRNNYLEIRLDERFSEITCYVKTTPPSLQLKFADNRSKTLGLYTVVLLDNSLRILKQTRNEYEKHIELSLDKYIIYLGSEKKRGPTKNWGITLVEKDFQKRTCDQPFIGHLLTGTKLEEQLIWYSAILYSLHESQLIPVPTTI